jgi:hypothetical protein
MVKYDIKQGLWKSVKMLVLFGLPQLQSILPQEWLQLSVGAALVLLYNFVKVRWNLKI